MKSRMTSPEANVHTERGEPTGDRGHAGKTWDAVVWRAGHFESFR